MGELHELLSNGSIIARVTVKREILDEAGLFVKHEAMKVTYVGLAIEDGVQKIAVVVK